jgi:hypothetical protein
MRSRLVDASSSFFGGRLIRLALGGIVAGGAALFAGVAAGRVQATLGALCAAWLFFAGVAAGGVAVSAALRVAQATWAGRIVPIAEAASAFLVPSLGILLVLLVTARSWMPGLVEEGVGAWLFLAVRVFVSTVVLVVAARRYLASSRAGAAAAARDAVVYLLVYVVALTIWAIDLIVGLSEGAPSTVVPPFYFMGAFLGAVAWTTLIVSVRALGGAARQVPVEPARTDLAKILFSLSILWFYLLWSGFLPVWYANLPEETGQLLSRWEGGFKPVTIAVVAAVFFVPFWVLMPGSAKRRPARVAAGAASILAGLAGERFLLVLPPLHARGPWPAIAGLAMTAGMLGAFLLTAGAELHARRELA